MHTRVRCGYCGCLDLGGCSSVSPYTRRTLYRNVVAPSMVMVTLMIADRKKKPAPSKGFSSLDPLDDATVSSDSGTAENNDGTGMSETTNEDDSSRTNDTTTTELSISSSEKGFVGNTKRRFKRKAR